MQDQIWPNEQVATQIVLTFLKERIRGVRQCLFSMIEEEFIPRNCFLFCEKGQKRQPMGAREGTKLKTAAGVNSTFSFVEKGNEGPRAVDRNKIHW